MSSNTAEKQTLPLYLSAPPVYFLILWEFFHHGCTFLALASFLPVQIRVLRVRECETEKKAAVRSMFRFSVWSWSLRQERCDSGLQRGENLDLHNPKPWRVVWYDLTVPSVFKEDIKGEHVGTYVRGFSQGALRFSPKERIHLIC